MPKLRFPEFNEDWEKKDLGEIVTLMQSGLSRKLEGKDIGLPVLRSNNLLDNKLDLADIRYWYDIDDKGANLENYFLKEGDLLVNFINSIKQIGKTAIYNGELKRKAIFTTNIMRLNFNSNTDVFFVHNCFQTKKYLDYIQSITKPAVNQASFTTVDFKRFNLNVPSLSEQKKIAFFLSKLDEKIEKLEKKQELWETYKKGIMQQIFSQKLRFKDENGEDYPDWEERKLEDLATFKNGVNKSKADFGIGFPFVNLMDVFGKNSISKRNFDLVNVTKKELKEYDLIKGDVLFIRSSVKKSGVGLTVVISECLPNTVYSGFLIRFREKKPVLDLNFKKYCFYTGTFRNSLINKSSTSANTNINQESLKTLILKVPTIKEQREIATFLSSIDNKVDQIGQELILNKLFKKGLLQQMFC